MLFDRAESLIPRGHENRTNAVASLNREDLYSAVEPYINTEGIHQWPFDPLFPLDVRLFTLDGPGNIRMNRHDYFELGLVLSGEAIFQIQERNLPVREGDLVVMGNSLYHAFRKSSRRGFEAVFFYFEPGRCGRLNRAATIWNT